MRARCGGRLRRRPRQVDPQCDPPGGPGPLLPASPPSRREKRETSEILTASSFPSCPVSQYSTARGGAPCTQPGVLGTLPTATSGARSVSDEGEYPVSIPASSTAGSLPAPSRPDASPAICAYLGSCGGWRGRSRARTWFSPSGALNKSFIFKPHFTGAEAAGRPSRRPAGRLTSSCRSSSSASPPWLWKPGSSAGCPRGRRGAWTRRSRARSNPRAAGTRVRSAARCRGA